jgi:hypothetical protein
MWLPPFPPSSPEKKEHKNAIHWIQDSSCSSGPSEQVLHFLHELLVGVVLGKLGLSLLHLQDKGKA